MKKLPAVILGLFLSTNVCHLVAGEDQQCPRDPKQPDVTCACKTEHGIIDLTPLSASSEQAPRFKKIEGGSKNEYFSYNPCQVFSAQGQTDCLNTYVCYYSTSYISSIGDEAGSEKIYIDSHGVPYLLYSTLTTSVKIALECTKSSTPEMKFKGRIGSPFNTIYEFSLASSQACAGAPVSEKAKASIVGVAGLVIMILLLVALIAYCVIGAAIQRYKYEAEIGTDMIPNKVFWKELPLLVKDGCVFTFKPIARFFKRTRNEYTTLK